MRSMDRGEALDKLQRTASAWIKKEKERVELRADFLKMILNGSGAAQVMEGNVDRVAGDLEKSLRDLGVEVK